MEIDTCELSETKDDNEGKGKTSNTTEKNTKCETSNTTEENTKCETSNINESVNDDNEKETNEENVSESRDTDESHGDASPKFKKPVLLVGPKRGKVKKLKVVSDAKETEQTQSMQNMENETSEVATNSVANKESDSMPQSVPAPQKDIPLSYTEPSWSGMPEKEYKLEVLKSGMILDTIDLSKKSFHVIGRLPTCDIPLAHPTISRYHAILQYRLEGNEKNPSGLYLYDLGSINGTFWNGNRVRPNMYVRIQGGHMIRFGCSQRKFIVQAPPEDQEEESEFTVTELKQKRMLELEEREKERLLREEEMRLEKEKEESAGIDWGMGEDADEETDLSENPYASTGNEELFLNDPKKTLRGWFEREGYELQYQTEEKGIGQFLCWVDLPVENVTGHSVRAEAVVKGKKKESVIQCALEACRILDRLGLLRQANHEARKKKTRNWEEEDYYDSDEDNFLDRTGSIEKKREQRMRLAGKLETKVETYSSLLEKHANVAKQISRIEKCLDDARQAKEANADNGDEDALDAFMSTLNKPVLNKGDMRKMKLELQNLRKEESKLKELVNLAKPANLPPLTTNPLLTQSDDQNAKESANVSTRQKSIIANIGQRKKLQTTTTKNDRNLSRQTTLPASTNVNDSNEEEEEEEESENEETSVKTSDMKKDDFQKEETDTNDNGKSKSISEAEEKSTIHDKSEDTEKSDTAKDSSKSNKNNNDERISNKRSLENVTSKRNEAKKAKKKETEKLSNLDVYRDDYSTWLPPQGQTGDGKTSLNEKFGY